MGRHNHREHVFQIEVSDYGCRPTKYRDYKNPLWWDNEGNQGKVVDILPPPPSRTLIPLSHKNTKAIKRWARRFGMVTSCHKVDKSYYLENIEHLNLHQEPLTIEVEQEDFVLTKALELERPRKRFEDKKYNIEIIDKDIDKEE